LFQDLEANLAVLDSERLDGDWMLNGHVDEVVHALLCAQVANSGSVSWNSHFVKYGRLSAKGRS
jgi:uncharacterized protein YqfA (UPF0365 family)